MAIAFDSSTQDATSGNSPWNVSHTIASGSDRLLIACVSSGYGMSSVDHGMYSMTLVQRQTYSAPAYFIDWVVEIWSLIAPATGTNNLTFTPNSGPSSAISVGISSWTGVHQSTPTGTPSQTAQTNQSNASISTSAASATGDVVIDATAVYNRTLTAGGGQTALASVLNYPGLFHSSKAGAASSTTMSESWSGGQLSSQIAVALKPVSPPPPVKRDGMFFGAI